VKHRMWGCRNLSPTNFNINLLQMLRIGSVLLTSAMAAHAATYDGPAELPRVYVQSTLASTIASGTSWNVPAGGDFQAALNRAHCGDTIRLQAGATFAGVYTFPAKSCDNSHWIIIRTSAPDSSLPPEGTRITPCYAGVSSLPGRPALNCTSTKNVMAKVVISTPFGSGPIGFAPLANHYRLIGLEVTRPAGPFVIYNLAFVQNSGVADHIIFDRVWMHGTVHDDTSRAILLSGMSYVAVVDSFFTDFHCTAITGACSDAQAISGGIGMPGGVYKIVHNFLEASAESILFGGGSATTTPADIEIRRNHFFKPLTWMVGQPGFVGGTNGNSFVIKNHFELKNAQRVLFEGNILENSWGGFSQTGFAILLTPKNQVLNGINVCSLCQVTDVTIRLTKISHVAGGLQIDNGTQGLSAALAGERYSVHDIVADDINGAKYRGPGIFAQLSSSAAAPLLNNVSIDHVTAFSLQSIFMIGNPALGPKMPHLTVTNSIVNATPYPLWSTGGITNCAFADVPITTLNSCFSPYLFTDNVFVAPTHNYPSSSWPLGNYYPSSMTAVGFTSYNNGNGGNYQLTSSSPYINKGTDGKNIGADIAAINQATSLVY
jgi:hypothetical protein